MKLKDRKTGVNELKIVKGCFKQKQPFVNAPCLFISNYCYKKRCINNNKTFKLYGIDMLRSYSSLTYPIFGYGL